MANYGKYYIAVRLLLLKQYLEANAGKNRIVSRRDLEAFLDGGFVRFWQLDFKVGNIPAFHKKPHQCFQISCVGSHRNLIQIGGIPQSNIKILHCLLVQGGNRGIGRDSLVNLLDRFPIVVDCPLPKIPCFAVQYIFLKTVHESFLS